MSLHVCSSSLKMLDRLMDRLRAVKKSGFHVKLSRQGAGIFNPQR